MILKRQRKCFEFLDKSFGDRERTALNFAVDLSNSDAELFQMGSAARAFVLEGRNNVIQAKKLLEMLE